MGWLFLKWTQGKSNWGDHLYWNLNEKKELAMQRSEERWIKQLWEISNKAQKPTFWFLYFKNPSSPIG